MKGNKKVLAVALLLLLVAVSFGTYAIYKTSVGGTGTVTAATWDVEFKNGETTLENSFNLTFSGTDCQNAHVANGKIAPGASCTKTIAIDASGTEVDVAYTATAGTVTATKDNNTVATTGANEFSVTLSPASGTIAYSSNSTATNITVTVTWAGAANDSDATNTADIGLSGATISVPITLTATQVLGN